MSTSTRAPGKVRAAAWGNRARSIEILERVLVICAYNYGAGYDPDSGRVELAEAVKPGTELYVEYFYDAPAAAGQDNIKVYVHPEI